jgi:preprotein translocase subunit SecD
LRGGGGFAKKQLIAIIHSMFKRRFWAIILILVSALIGYFVYSTNGAESNRKFKLGLDLNGGIELIYKADTSNVEPADVSAKMNSLKGLIEKRVNVFGVSEPIIQIERVNIIGGESSEQLIVGLPGQTDISSAIAQVGKTYILEFKFLKNEFETATSSESISIDGDSFESTGLTGALLEKATLEFNPTTGEPNVALQFNNDGSDLFAKITKENIGRRLAIFLDGDIKSSPVIREEITGGKASISGGFIGSAGLKEAKDLVSNLNLGALPIPIELVSTQSIGASLGLEAVKASTHAGLWAFIVVAIFLITWYRLPGLLAVISLFIYCVLNLALFKLIPVTLTAAGIAGFILSLGMAVDANILIFERMKEELARGRELGDAVKEGFARAWLSIRDSNSSSIITAIILYSFSSTAIVKGFALVFGFGVIVSMFTAITASRTLLLAIKSDRAGKFTKFLFGSGANFSINSRPVNK